MTITTAVARYTAAPVLRANGTIAAACPLCGTIGTTFRPEPGAMIWQKCHRRDCGQMFALYVFPHWMEILTEAVEIVRAERDGPPIDGAAPAD